MIRMVKSKKLSRMSDDEGNGMERVKEGGVEKIKLEFKKLGINEEKREVDRVEK